MKSLFILLLSGVFSFNFYAQTGPWQSPLKICTGASPTIFNAATVFQDSSGVPSVIRKGTASSDTLMAALQWFPAPMFSTYWDKVAIKFSYNGGTTWTTPTTCTFVGLPVGYQRPFDPSLVQMPNKQIRIYFSCGVNSPPPGGIDSYSGLSNDGITYTFEPGPKYNDASKNAIDPSVAYFGSAYYYNSWTGTNTNGAFRATSNNATSFTVQTVFPYDGTHLWLGNYMLDGTTMRFYGCGSNIWMNSTTDGTTWAGYSNTNASMGADPAVVRNKAGTYILIYTGPPNLTGVQENIKPEENFIIYPNSFSESFTISRKDGNDKLNIEIFDSNGKKVFTGNVSKDNSSTTIDLALLSAGFYYCTVSSKSGSFTKRIIKNN